LAKDPQFFSAALPATGSVLQDRSVPDRGRFYFLLAKSFAEPAISSAHLYLRSPKKKATRQINEVKKILRSRLC